MQLQMARFTTSSKSNKTCYTKRSVATQENGNKMLQQLRAAACNSQSVSCRIGAETVATAAAHD